MHLFERFVIIFFSFTGKQTISNPTRAQIIQSADSI